MLFMASDWIVQLMQQCEYNKKWLHFWDTGCEYNYQRDLAGL